MAGNLDLGQYLHRRAIMTFSAIAPQSQKDFHNEQLIRLHAAQGLDLEQGERGPVRQHQSSGRGCHARQGTAGWAGTRSSSIRWARRTARRSPSCSRSCWRRATRGAEYDAWLIKIGEGEQFGSGFVAVNPNSKIPAPGRPQRADAGPPVRVGRDAALSRREIRHPDAEGGVAGHAECLSWLFWQMGSAPYLGGGFGHFYAYAPTKIEYAIDRFAMETKRQLDVLDRRLSESRYLAGDDYTIADIAVWPWYGGLAKGLLYGAGEFLSVAGLSRTSSAGQDLIGERPAVKRGRIVNRLQGDPKNQLHERHDASDFDLRTQGQDRGQGLIGSATESCRSFSQTFSAAGHFPLSPPLMSAAGLAAGAHGSARSGDRLRRHRPRTAGRPAGAGRIRR